METNKQGVTGGTNLFTLLLVLFVGLKLAGIGAVADWSWWWVLSPFWAPLLGVLLVLIGIWVAAGAVAIWDAAGRRRDRKVREKLYGKSKS